MCQQHILYILYWLFFVIYFQKGLVFTTLVNKLHFDDFCCENENWKYLSMLILR